MKVNIFLEKTLKEPVAWTGIDVRLLMHRIWMIIEGKTPAKQGISKKNQELRMKYQI